MLRLNVILFLLVTVAEGDSLSQTPKQSAPAQKDTGSGAAPTAPRTAVFDSSALKECPPKPPLALESCQLRSKIDELANRYDDAAKAWSFGHHAAVILSIMLGALAALLSKKDDTDAATMASARAIRNRSIGALCALAATVLTSIAAAGGFPGKWRANRDARTDATVLQLMVSNPTVSVKAVRESLIVVIRRQNLGINAAESAK
jgi:hypothetical protein